MQHSYCRQKLNIDDSSFQEPDDTCSCCLGVEQFSSLTKHTSLKHSIKLATCLSYTFSWSMKAASTCYPSANIFCSTVLKKIIWSPHSLPFLKHSCSPLMFFSVSLWTLSGRTSPHTFPAILSRFTPRWLPHSPLLRFPVYTGTMMAVVQSAGTPHSPPRPKLPQTSRPSI